MLLIAFLASFGRRARPATVRDEPRPRQQKRPHYALARNSSKVIRPSACSGGQATLAHRAGEAAGQPHRQHRTPPAGRGEPAAGQVGHRPDLWTAQVGCASGRCGDGQRGQPVANVADVDRLEARAAEHRQHRGSTEDAEQPGEQVVELGGAQNGPRHGVALDQALDLEPVAVVAEGHPVDPDDRDVDEVGHPRVPGRREPL
jgi:hypothetical protein